MIIPVSLDSISIPKSIHEAISHLGWHRAMIEEMTALDDNGTWDLVSLPAGKRVIGCKWVFTVKVNPDGSVAQLKARLVAKGYAQTYGVDYSNTFSHVAKLTYILTLHSVVTQRFASYSSMRPNFLQRRRNNLMWIFYLIWSMLNLHLKNIQYEYAHDLHTRYHVRVLLSNNIKFVLTLPNDELLEMP